MKLEILVGSETRGNRFPVLNQMKLLRFNVEATDINTAGDIFGAYYTILSKEFFAETQDLLNRIYTVYRGFISDMYNSNPFESFAETFTFLYDGSQRASFNIQYYYDFFNDLQQTYNELVKVGFGINKSGCLPGNTFPRHLILGNITTDADDFGSNNRTYFTPSPLLEKQYDLVQQLRFLFRKLVLMIHSIPVDSEQKDSGPQEIIITPSKLGNFTLSQKAIPFYYSIEDEAAPLLRFWSYEKTLQGIADQNLSYNAGKYAKEDFVKQPLDFDLEPYNFLRVEGILGNPYKTVSEEIKQQIRTFRLPIKVIGLPTGSSSKSQRDVSMRSFLEEHPGIQHKAGVTVGGTFILIYKGDSDENVPNIENGIVIADFYLPYICCAVKPVERGVFTIQPRFLFDDAHNYPFTIQPQQNSIADIENKDHLSLLTDESNQLFLHPAMELKETLQTTLVYNDIELSITIIKPDAAFTLTISKTNETIGPLVQVAAKNTDADNYAWTINQRPPGILANVAAPASLNFSQLLDFDSNQLRIELEITYNINNQVSTDINFVTFSMDQVKGVKLNESIILQSKETD